MAERTNGDRVPTTFVAFSSQEPVGSACLVEHDMDSRPDLTPWLAGVFVLPQHRGRKIGSALIVHATQQARDFGVSRLFLYTNGSESLYSHLGWRPVGREFYEGQWVTLITSSLAA